MKLTQGIEWSIHSLALLGALPEGLTLRIEKMAEFYELPTAYLRKQLQALSRANLVEATTGPGGGYKLARPADQITLLDVYIAIEGDENCFRCMEIRQQGPSAVDKSSYKRPCNIASAMYRAEKAWRDELAKVTIAGVIKDAQEQMPPEQRQKGIDWFTKVLGGQ